MSKTIGTKEFAERYGVDQGTVARWCREGKIANAYQDAPGSPWHIPEYSKPPVSYKRKRKDTTK